MDNKKFKIREYGRQELASLYDPTITPAAAWAKLKTWIAVCPGLPEQLQVLGYRTNQRIFTPAQVIAIISAIGEP